MSRVAKNSGETCITWMSCGCVRPGTNIPVMLCPPDSSVMRVNATDCTPGSAASASLVRLRSCGMRSFS